MTTKHLTLCALMCAVMCVLCPFSVPIGPVPVTLGVFAVYLVCYALPPLQAVIVCALYLLMGCIGLPVFSGYTSGPARLTGPTGGFLIGFLFLALIAGYLISRADKVSANNALRLAMQAAGMVLGLCVCYLFGTLWYMIYMRESQVTFVQALLVCVVPFLAVDAVKIAVALVAGNALRLALKRAHLLPAVSA